MFPFARLHVPETWRRGVCHAWNFQHVGISMNFQHFVRHRVVSRFEESHEVNNHFHTFLTTAVASHFLRIASQVKKDVFCSVNR